MIITTTPSVDGYRIVQYFPPVVANMVMGTGFLNDFAASFTDFFGGKSGTYQTYLRDMHASALVDLEAKAKTAGANCLIGATFDFDQISGKGVQMLMLNAVATPVLIKTDGQIAEEAEAAQRVQDQREQLLVERRERLSGGGAAGVGAIRTLLADEEVARQARKVQQMYGRAVCASYLQRKAQDFGLGDIDVTEDDIPESF